MADIAEAFKQHLRSLSDDEWRALEHEVRAPQQSPAPTGPTLPGERREDDPVKSLKNAGLEEARRRGYVDANGDPVKR